MSLVLRGEKPFRGRQNEPLSPGNADICCVADRAAAWDEDYRRRGNLWGGAPAALPGIDAGAAVLELGCGNGKTLSALARRSSFTTAIDISPHAVALARRHSEMAGVCFVVADARHLPFRPESFDAVFLIHIVGHLPISGRKALAAEVCRVLTPGGRTFFRGFSVEDMRAGKGAETEQWTFRRDNGINTHYFTEDEVRDLFMPLAPARILTHRWSMRVRGRDLPRAEVEAVFEKTGTGTGADIPFLHFKTE